MLKRNLNRICLRPLLWERQKTTKAPVYRRLAERTHRSIYASLERETNTHRSVNASVKLKPRISDFLIFLHRKQDHKLGLTTIRPAGLPLLYKEAVLIETGLFHILACIHSNEAEKEWLDTQTKHLLFLHSHVLARRRIRTLEPRFSLEDAHILAKNLDVSVLGQQASVLLQSLNFMSIACPSILNLSDLVPWIRSLCAAKITDACAELANLTNIPACVSSDILLRTPLSIDEVALQRDLWLTFIEPICQDYIDKKSHITSIIKNLVLYTAQYDPQKLEPLLVNTASLLLSTTSGFAYKIITDEFLNSLLYFLALTFIKTGRTGMASPMPIIKAQKVLVEYLGNEKLSQQGYVGITLLISHESAEKADKLWNIVKTRFPENSKYMHIAMIYLSNTPEELLHNFNVAVKEYPMSATMWLMLIKKLLQLHLLNESRSHNLLRELLARKQDVLISKDVMLVLLGLVVSISGIEDIIEMLQKSGLFEKFKKVVLNKYMALLYRQSEEKSVHKPFLDQHIRHSSNLECARYLYHQNEWKTTSIIGVMLQGEATHRPAEIYNLYCAELQGSLPDEACLSALLRASMRRVDGKPILWGLLYAPQVAVHEFKQHVIDKDSSKETGALGVVASNRLWQIYIHALRAADYTAELADVIRWWEGIHFIPSRSTLSLLLRALPDDFADRHIKHAHSLPRTGVSWPWPTIDQIRD